MAIGAGPRANFVCLGKKCLKDGESPVYELPVGAARCPVCSSKRIKRLFDAVNISQPGFFQKNRVVDAEGARAFERLHDQADARIAALKRQTPQLAVPIRNLGPALARLHPAFGAVALDTANGSRPTGEGFAHPVARTMRGRPPRPGPGSLNLGGSIEESA